MDRGCEPTTAARHGWLPLRLSPCVLVLGLIGCVPEPAFDNDPLLGGKPLPRNGAVAAAPKPAASASGTPWVPPPSGAASPAALAAGAPPADPGALRIGPPPAALTSSPHDGGDPWRSAGPAAGATLKQPEPIADASLQPTAMIAPPTAGGPTPAGPPLPAVSQDQYEQLQDMLAKRGVLFQSLEGPDENGAWRFSCGVPKAGDPGAIHRVEATARGEHGLAAVRSAIDQIDKESR